MADSACSATAYLCGVKANHATIGVTGKVKLGDYVAGDNTDNHVDSIVQWAQHAGKATGIVTTTRVTHASPAGTYAHTSHRDWECDANIPPAAINARDIASQLIFNDPGRSMNVIFGGGRSKFLPAHVLDNEGIRGRRHDGIDLIETWRNEKGANGQYVTNRRQLLALNQTYSEYVLGLFAASHMPYNLDADHEKHPTLAEMTMAAIHQLSRNPKGYFLFVEGGRIDHAHHENKARKALDETVQFSEAVRMAQQMTNDEETLIVVTADHAHTMSISGYSARGEDILGLSSELSNKDRRPFTTLNYATGPKMMVQPNGTRTDLSNVDFGKCVSA